MSGMTETIPQEAATPPDETAKPLSRRRWTGTEFDRMMELGFIRKGSSTFLWKGDVIPSESDHEPDGTFLRRRWTEAQFDRMVELGFVHEGCSAFLWDGEIIEPIPEDQPHLNAAFTLALLLATRLPEADYTVNMNQPIPLEPRYRPQPDISVAYGPRALFSRRGHRPKPSDVALLIEVSDTSYAVDSGDLLERYAAGGVPGYWIVNIRARRIEVYTNPDQDARHYRVRTDYGLDAAVPLRIGTSEFPPVDVIDVLRNSLDDGDPAVE